MKTYLKLLGIYSDDLLTEVMAEVHKDNLNQVRDYIEEYEKGVSKNESDNITWIIKKQFYWFYNQMNLQTTKMRLHKIHKSITMYFPILLWT